MIMRTGRLIPDSDFRSRNLGAQMVPLGLVGDRLVPAGCRANFQQCGFGVDSIKKSRERLMLALFSFALSANFVAAIPALIIQATPL
jgi:hypothetical protein